MFKKFFPLFLMVSVLMISEQLSHADELELQDGELAYQLYELDSPLSFTIEETEVEIIAYEVIVNHLKHIELNIFYNFSGDTDIINDQLPDKLINVKQEDESVSIIESKILERNDEYDIYRSSKSPDFYQEDDLYYSAISYEIFNTISLLEIGYYEPGLLNMFSDSVRLDRWRFGLYYEFDDEPDDEVEDLSGPGVIETRNAFINLTNVEIDDKLLYLTYELTPKTLYNTIDLIEQNYILLYQKGLFGGQTMLVDSTSTNIGDTSDQEEPPNEYLEAGETVEVTKVIELENEEKPIFLLTKEIATDDTYFDDDIDLLINSPKENEAQSKDEDIRVTNKEEEELEEEELEEEKEEEEETETNQSTSSTIEEAVISTLSSNTSATEDSIIVTENLEATEAIVTVEFPAREAFTRGGIRYNIYNEMIDILYELKDLDYYFIEITLMAELPLVDQYGNTDDYIVMRGHFNQEILDRLGPEKMAIVREDIPSIAIQFYTDPAIE